MFCSSDIYKLQLSPFLASQCHLRTLRCLAGQWE
ncbi:hypothetical protein OROMI_010606 [Orobanche minor]